MRRTLIRALLVFSLVTFGLFAVQAPASAAWTDCNITPSVPEKLCYYQGANGTGSMYYHTNDGFSFSGACFNMSAAMNNTVTSIKNVTDRTFMFYRASNCAYSGSCCPAVPNGKKILPFSQNSFANVVYIDNQLSSLRFLCFGSC